MKRILFLVVICLLISSCGTKKTVSKRSSSPHSRSGKNVPDDVSDWSVEADKIDRKNRKSRREIPIPNSTSEYIEFYKSIAIDEMHRYSIPASITLAQGILESGSGRGRLAVKANNHFGIKCHEWTGKKIYHDDDKSQECFRQYEHPAESYRDHSVFLTSRKRYYKLFDLRLNDYKSWAKELRRAGYATDKRYPQKLIELIERYDLYQYDIKGKKVKRKPKPKKGHTIYNVVQGDTLYSIARRYNMSIDELKTINNLKSNDIKIGQSLKVLSN